MVYKEKCKVTMLKGREIGVSGIDLGVVGAPIARCTEIEHVEGSRVTFLLRGW